MLLNKNGKYASILIALIVLMLLLTQCQSLQPETIIVKETIPPPKISFPVPPDPTGWVEYGEDGETIIVDTEYWVQLAEYMIDVEAVRQKYEAIREEYKDKE